MRYLYGLADEKFVKKPKIVSRPFPYNRSTLHAYTTGKHFTNDFNREDVSIVFKCSPDKLLNLCAKSVDELPLSKVYAWTIEDICRWLREIGFKQYQNTFRENLINGRTLLLLDASALSAMNIKDFDHIKSITYGIRSLFYYEMTKFGQRFSVSREFLCELFQLFRTKSGIKYESVRRSELFRIMQLIRDNDPNYEHWETLERWLAFEKEHSFPELVSGVPIHKAYCCRSLTTGHPTPLTHHLCLSCIPPCYCRWGKDNCRPPWRFKCLPHLLPDKEYVLDCPDCVPPCTCRWTSKKFGTKKTLSVLKKTCPHRYGNSSLGLRFDKESFFSSYPLIPF